MVKLKKNIDIFTALAIVVFLIFLILLSIQKESNPLLTVRITGNVTNLNDSTCTVEYNKIIHGNQSNSFAGITVEYEKKSLKNFAYLRENEPVYLNCGQYPEDDKTAIKQIEKKFKNNPKIFSNLRLALPLTRTWGTRPPIPPKLNKDSHKQKNTASRRTSSNN